jgi:hypothetical protein
VATLAAADRLHALTVRLEAAISQVPGAMP